MPALDLVVLGETNLDLILYGLEEELPIEREVLAKDFRMTLGGSSSILAHNLAALGCRVGFITKVGGDPLGAIALERLHEVGVDLPLGVVHAQSQTGVTILLHHGATRRILTYPGVMAELTVAEIDREYLRQAKHLHISSLFLQRGLHAGLPELCRDLRASGCTVSLDTNDDPDDQWGSILDSMLDAIDLLLPNDDEALRMTRCDNLDEAIDRLARRVPVVAVKQGRSGSVVRQGSQCWHIPAISVAAVDTIGAGDSFNAGFLKAFLAEEPLPICAAMGNVAAALSTQRPGGTEAFRDTEFRKAFLAQHISRA
ncbi:carbohydrate kinase family protein [Terriglobus albidus]|uniref:Carbohydrate kinase family protein n=1 Tax=Terriglobus albidus TaxID=1592106 RepID=A0A5B9ECH2_9BACT|nr:carbohydrate kinase family protein [Terriglobus albidus]QEE29812.1 carbohydrate kinase family protein [Terriglobus albidus]